jgi:hypothetical protein
MEEHENYHKRNNYIYEPKKQNRFEHNPNHAQMNTNVQYANCATSREKLKNIYYERQ